MRAPRCGLALGVALAVAALACGGNPALGDWEIDRDANRRSAVLAVEATDLTTIHLGRDALVLGDVVIPVRYVVEKGRVRITREDGRGEHLIEILPEERIRVELPIGVSVIYRRVGS